MPIISGKGRKRKRAGKGEIDLNAPLKLIPIYSTIILH